MYCVEAPASYKPLFGLCSTSASTSSTVLAESALHHQHGPVLQRPLSAPATTAWRSAEVPLRGTVCGSLLAGGDANASACACNEIHAQDAFTRRTNQATGLRTLRPAR